MALVDFAIHKKEPFYDHGRVVLFFGQFKGANMAEEPKDVNTEDSSTTEDVIEDSSTSEDVNDTEDSSTTEEQVQTEETVPYSRFLEANQQKNEANQRTANFEGQLQGIQSLPQSPTTDPDASLDAPTRLFYQDQEKRTQKIVDTALKSREVEYQAQIQALASQNAKIQEKLFRQDQTDVVRDSPEEVEIGELIRLGVDPDKAAMAVMGEKRIESAKTGNKTKQQVKTQQKAQANVEVTGIPTNSGVPTGDKLSFRDDLDKSMKEAGL